MGLCRPGLVVALVLFAVGSAAANPVEITPKTCADFADDETGCNGHGECIATVCRCYGGWTGNRCQNAPAPCSPGCVRGSCLNGVCSCPNGWTDDDCNTPTGGLTCLSDDTATCEYSGPASDAPCLTPSCINSACVWTEINVGKACDDGNACTENDVCRDGGFCQGDLILCQQELCRGPPQCNPALGCEAGQPLANDSPCESECEEGTCRDGSCVDRLPAEGRPDRCDETRVLSSSLSTSQATVLMAMASVTAFVGAAAVFLACTSTPAQKLPIENPNKDINLGESPRSGSTTGSGSGYATSGTPDMYSIASDTTSTGSMSLASESLVD